MDADVRHRKLRSQLSNQSSGWNSALVTAAVAPAKDVGGSVQQVAKYSCIPPPFANLYELSFHAGHMLLVLQLPPCYGKAWLDCEEGWPKRGFHPQAA